MFVAAINHSMTLYELVGRMQVTGDRDNVVIGEILDVMEKRGFGPMLAVPAFVCSTPVGAIPGIPTVTGIIILLISLQVMVGKTHPWLPERLRSVPVHRPILDRGIDKIKPWMASIDRFLMPRWLFMRQVVFRSLIAFSCALCGLMMIPLELIPFLGWIPAIAVLIMAIGMATDDGAVAMMGLALAGIGFTLGAKQIMSLLA